jgi:hypothetical protein
MKTVDVFRQRFSSTNVNFSFIVLSECCMSWSTLIVHQARHSNGWCTEDYLNDIQLIFFPM